MPLASAVTVAPMGDEQLRQPINKGSQLQQTPDASLSMLLHGYAGGYAGTLRLVRLGRGQRREGLS